MKWGYRQSSGWFGAQTVVHKQRVPDRVPPRREPVAKSVSPPHQSPQYLLLVCSKFHKRPWISHAKFRGQFEKRTFPHELD